MSGFLDKLKNGFAEAGNKAKIMVDVNRIKMQITQEQREIKETFETMGKKLFDLYQAGDLNDVKEQFDTDCQKIIRKIEEVHQLELKVIELNDEKECPDCKQVLEKEVRFCPECGFKFEDAVETEERNDKATDEG